MHWPDIVTSFLECFASYRKFCNIPRILDAIYNFINYILRKFLQKSMETCQHTSCKQYKLETLRLPPVLKTTVGIFCITIFGNIKLCFSVRVALTGKSQSLHLTPRGARWTQKNSGLKIKTMNYTSLENQTSLLMCTVERRGHKSPKWANILKSLIHYLKRP